MDDASTIEKSRMPKIVIVGAGATGGYLGAMLAAAGEDVTMIARGATLEALRRRGLRVVSTGGEQLACASPAATDDFRVVAGADFVVLTVKAYSLAELAPRLGPALGLRTAVVSAQNGIPWWYFHGQGGPLQGTRLESVDPAGILSRHLRGRRVIGCVVYPSTRVLEAGVIEHQEGRRFSLGEPDGRASRRARRLAAALERAGLEAPLRTDIRSEIWLKLLGNATLNPISALARGTLQDITQHPETRALFRAAMEEVDAVARRLGIQIPDGVERRLRGASRVGPHKTSMLQDVEAGRPLELDALLGSVIELADLVEVEVPRLRTLCACARLLDLGLRGEPVAPPVDQPSTAA